MFKNLLLILAFVSTSIVASAEQKQFIPYGQGMPAPWPFPWAKECPIKWSSITGRYVMFDQFEKDQIDLKLTVVKREGLKLMRISRYNVNGEMISDGVTVITEKQKSVRVYLRPLTNKTMPVWATLKLHYHDSLLSCDMSQLVPILTLLERRDKVSTEAQYRLVRRPIVQ